MKEFWSENSKIIGKLILNQFGATFFGLMIVAAASAAKDQKAWLMLFASVFATLFYLFLIYNVIWERGGQDRIRVDGGRAPRKPLTGLWIGLIANIPNILLGVLVCAVYPFQETQMWAGNLSVICRALVLLWEGMYAGVISYFAPYNPLARLLIVFPAIAVTALGYLMGLSNHRLLQPFELKQPKQK